MDHPRNIQSLIKHRCLVNNLLVILVYSISFSRAWAVSPNSVVQLEVFTATDRKVTGLSVAKTDKQAKNIYLQIYFLDDIQLVEIKLSRNLPSDPKKAKHIALDHIQQLDEQSIVAIENAAIGLAKVMQYGIDRYPAIVFDGKVVAYGLTDLRTAFDFYQAWREKN